MFLAVSTEVSANYRNRFATPVIKRKFQQSFSGNEVQADIIKRKGVIDAGTEEYMKRTIITVVGKDTIGIIAKVCTYLAENGINILDISQTIVQDYFNMMMIVDTSTMAKPFGDMVDEMTALGEETGVQIKCQKEEIFDKMHRI